MQTDGSLAASGYHVLILLDAIELSGPAKGILQFCELAPANVRITIANFHYPARGSAPFFAAARSANVNSVKLSQKNRLDLDPARQIKELCVRHGVDVVQSHSLKPHFLGRYARKSLGLPWIAWAHGWTKETLRVGLYNRYERMLLRKSDQLCVVSNAMRKEFLDAGFARERISVIRNAIIRPDSREVPRVSAEKDRIDLICIGRLSKEKGQDILLDALSDLRHFDWHLFLLGDGPMRASLERRADRLSIRHLVTFSGHVKETEKYMLQSDFLVSPSRSEGIPNVVLEAMSVGLPVLATNVGGVSEIIEHGENGFLMSVSRPGISTMLATALRLSDEERAMVGEHGRKSLYPRFDPRHRCARIMKVHELAMSLKAE